MTWIRLEDDFPHHPDVWTLPPQSAWLFVAGLCYSRHYLTDGFIGEDVLELVCRGAHPKHVVPLIPAHWQKVDGGWRIVNYDKYQQTKAEVEEQRESSRARSRRHRERTRASRRDAGVSDGEVTPREVEEEKDNTPLPPSRGVEVVCIRCQGKGVVEDPELANAYVDCDCKTRRAG